MNFKYFNLSSKTKKKTTHKFNLNQLRKFRVWLQNLQILFDVKHFNPHRIIKNNILTLHLIHINHKAGKIIYNSFHWSIILGVYYIIGFETSIIVKTPTACT